MRFALGIFGILCLIQGIGGLVQRQVNDYHGWYVMLYLFDDGTAQVVGSVAVIVLGVVLLYLTRDKKNAAS
ncbi:hypothetical protein [Actinosynnema mirum]|uniref:hypothetical protein n=1 Tax=Actinosynnema mirum TaxID=40567 RepID=UPI0016514009|nr:hypothetical protein [Actinosynnema mirum]